MPSNTARHVPSNTNVRATVTLGESAHHELIEAAERAGMSVPEYIRRALAFQSALDRYITSDNTLVVVDPEHQREVHLQLIG